MAFGSRNGSLRCLEVVRETLNRTARTWRLYRIHVSELRGLGGGGAHGEKRTSEVSIARGRMSGRDRLLIITSSSGLLETMNTTKPFLSRSKASDRVKWRDGDPARTTTSVRPPLRDRFARLVFRSFACVV